MSEMRFPADAVLHFPSLAGVKFGGVDDPGAAEYANRIYLASGPLVVIERDQKFTAITWSPWDARIGKDHPGVSRAGDAWLLKFPAGADVRPFPAESSLDAAVAHYRAEHLSSDDVRGRAVLDRVRRCVLLDMQLVDGRIAHNFSDATRLLRDLEKLDLARGALLYLPGWHGPYDSNMPKWTPADALGGRDGFAELVRVSKDLGAIVFPHFNYWGYDPATNLLGENWKELWTGEGWSGNSGYFKGNPLQYMAIDHPLWIELFDRYFDDTVASFGLEAVFLDQMAIEFENPKCDLKRATRSLLERIHTKFPNLLIGAEQPSEHVIDHVPLFQMVGLFEEDIPRFSPIQRLMFERRAKFFPHIFLTAATPCRYVYTNLPLIAAHGTEQVFRWYQERNRAMCGIPTVRLDYARHGIDELSLAVLRET